MSRMLTPLSQKVWHRGLLCYVNEDIRTQLNHLAALVACADSNFRLVTPEEKIFLANGSQRTFEMEYN